MKDELGASYKNIFALGEQAKVEVKNGVTSRTLTETTKKAKSTKPAPAKPMAKVAAKKMVSAKKPMMKGTK